MVARSFSTALSRVLRVRPPSVSTPRARLQTSLQLTMGGGGTPRPKVYRRGDHRGDEALLPPEIPSIDKQIQVVSDFFDQAVRDSEVRCIRTNPALPVEQRVGFDVERKSRIRSMSRFIRRFRLRCFRLFNFEAGTRRPSDLAFAVLSLLAGWTLTLMLPDDRLTSTLLHLFRFRHH
jgi:hypothetical protein